MDKKSISPWEDLKINRLTQVRAGLRLTAWTLIPGALASPIAGICCGVLWALTAADALKKEQEAWELQQSDATEASAPAKKIKM